MLIDQRLYDGYYEVIEVMQLGVNGDEYFVFIHWEFIPLINLSSIQNRNNGIYFPKELRYYAASNHALFI